MEKFIGAKIHQIWCYFMSNTFQNVNEFELSSSSVETLKMFMSSLAEMLYIALVGLGLCLRPSSTTCQIELIKSLT
jgi:hypothetical protein